jgi:hypothetical protein
LCYEKLSVKVSRNWRRAKMDSVRPFFFEAVSSEHDIRGGKYNHPELYSSSSVISFSGNDNITTMQVAITAGDDLHLVYVKASEERVKKVFSEHGYDFTNF